MMDAFVQVLILITGAISIWTVSRKEDWRKWGYLVGLLGQPFWMYTTFQSEQWGIFFLGFWYTYAWCQGIWNFIIIPRRQML